MKPAFKFRETRQGVWEFMHTDIRTTKVWNEVIQLSWGDWDGQHDWVKVPTFDPVTVALLVPNLTPHAGYVEFPWNKAKYVHPTWFRGETK